MSLRRALESSGQRAVGAAELADLMEIAGVGTGAGVRFPAEVGLFGIGSPGRLAGPARRVIWWGFTRDAAERPAVPPFSPAELAELAGGGAGLPEPGLLAEWDRESWLRPFRLATEELLLVCPQFDEALEPAYPHPMWDEVTAPLDRAEVARLTRATPGGIAPTEQVKRLALPRPAERWTLGAGARLEPLPALSPSSIGDLLGCPLSYVLSRDAGLGARLPVALPAENLLFGKIAHRVFERLFGAFVGRPLPDAEEAARRAGTLFDEELPRLATPLGQAGQDTDRVTLRRRITVGAAALVTQLGAGRVAAVEERLARQTAQRSFRGFADLLLVGPPALVDYKWGRSKYLAPALEAGTAYQLAVYAWCLGKGRGPLPWVAYFSIQDAALVTTTSAPFPGATRVEGPDPRVTLDALDRALARIGAARAAGSVLCPGTPEDEDEGVIEEACIDEEGLLCLPPGCHFCELNDLCQREATR